MVHTVFQNLNRTKQTKQTLKTLIFCNNLAFVVKQQKEVLEKKDKHPKKQNGHLGASFCANMVLFEKSTGDVCKTLFFCKFLRFSALDLLTLSFWGAFCFLVFRALVSSFTLSCRCFIIRFPCSGCCFMLLFGFFGFTIC